MSNSPELRQRIIARMEPGQWYTQKQLEATRIALNHLRREGLVKRRKISGFFVANPEASCEYALKDRGSL